MALTVAAPLGTHTAWHVHRPQPCEMCDRDRSFISFARTVRGNPRRPFLEECAVTSDLTPRYDRVMLVLDRPLPSREQALLARGLVCKKVEVVKTNRTGGSRFSSTERRSVSGLGSGSQWDHHRR